MANADVDCPTHTCTQHRHAHTHAQTGRQTLTHTLTEADDTYSHTRTKRITNVSDWRAFGSSSYFVVAFVLIAIAAADVFVCACVCECARSACVCCRLLSLCHYLPPQQQQQRRQQSDESVCHSFVIVIDCDSTAQLAVSASLSLSRSLSLVCLRSHVCFVLCASALVSVGGALRRERLKTRERLSAVEFDFAVLRRIGNCSLAYSTFCCPRGFFD